MLKKKEKKVKFEKRKEIFRMLNELKLTKKVFKDRTNKILSDDIPLDEYLTIYFYGSIDSGFIPKITINELKKIGAFNLAMSYELYSDVIKMNPKLEIEDEYNKYYDGLEFSHHL